MIQALARTRLLYTITLSVYLQSTTVDIFLLKVILEVNHLTKEFHPSRSFREPTQMKDL